MSKRIRAMYFTGTGTTKKITEKIASEMLNILESAGYSAAENINFSVVSARENSYEFDENDVVVFGTPVIAGRVPNVLLKFLDTIKGGGALAIPVVLYGNRNYDDALIELRNILEKDGFHTVAAAAFIGEHSFSKTLAAGRPDEDDMSIADKFAEAVAEKIKSETIDTPVEVKGCDPIREYYKPRDRKGNHINILKVKPKVKPELCTSCGICAKLCPMGSISIEAPGIVNGICIKCCGCVKGCPENALYYDDEGYLYHKEELELEYADRKEPELFL